MRPSTRRKILRLGKKLGRSPQVVILILPGQPPGKYFPEHDRRIIKALEIWQDCLSLPCQVKILCTSGTPDKNGLICAHYMKNQLIHYARALRLGNVEPFIEIGETQSGSTAGQILHSRDDLLQRHPDLVILISNWPHLLVAASYFKHLIPEIRFVKEWSKPWDGCIGMKRWPFLLREICHYWASMTIDRSGRHFENVVSDSIRRWSQLTYPPIPPSES